MRSGKLVSVALSYVLEGLPRTRSGVSNVPRIPRTLETYLPVCDLEEDDAKAEERFIVDAGTELSALCIGRRCNIAGTTHLGIRDGICAQVTFLRIALARAYACHFLELCAEMECAQRTVCDVGA
jgi:hypothetical protein